MIFDMEKHRGREIYNLLIGLVAPRPIALVTSMNEDGRLNAAPFSSYNYLCTDPPIIGMGVTDRPDAGFVPKDTARNIRRTGEFVVNVVTEDLMPRMNICATDFPAEVNELEMAGLTTAPSQVVKVPRIAEAHAALECREFTTHGDRPVADHSGKGGFDLCRGPVCRSGGTVRARGGVARDRPNERSGLVCEDAGFVSDDAAHLV